MIQKQVLFKFTTTSKLKLGISTNEDLQILYGLNGTHLNVKSVCFRPGKSLVPFFDAQFFVVAVELPNLNKLTRFDWSPAKRSNFLKLKHELFYSIQQHHLEG
jgi:hypothetical protein